MPGVRIVLLMPTLEQAKKVHRVAMLHELETTWKFLGARINQTDWRVTFPGGSWIQWVTAERAQLARGVRCDVVSEDEADDIAPDVRDAVVAPWFSEPHSLKIEIVGGTPRRGREGLLYRSYEAGQCGSPLAYSVHATYRDVPETVDREYVERTRATIAPEIFRREWECDFTASEGLVYSDFLPDFHVREPPPGTVWREMLVGVDWGWNDPGVFLLIGVGGSGADAFAWVLRETYMRERPLDWWAADARQIVGWYPQARWFCDPSRPDSAAYLKTHAGAKLVDTDNAIEDGIATVQNMLAIRTGPDGREHARLYVSPSCVHTIREMQLYRRKRDRKNPEQATDAPEDRDNHAPDALRYALHSRLGQAFGSKRSIAHVEARQV